MGCAVSKKHQHYWYSFLGIVQALPKCQSAVWISYVAIQGIHPLEYFNILCIAERNCG